MIRYILLLLIIIIATSFTGGCNKNNSGGTLRYTLSNEVIFFENVIDSFLQKGPVTSESLLVEPTPFRTDSTMKEQKWDEWIKEQDQLITSRKKILQNKGLKEIDIKVYQSCNFSSQKLPPKPNNSDFKLSQECKPFQHKRALEISLSQSIEDNKNDLEKRSVKATLFLNYGHIEYEFTFHKKEEGWIIAKRKKLSGILS